MTKVGLHRTKRVVQFLIAGAVILTGAPPVSAAESPKTTNSALTECGPGRSAKDTIDGCTAILSTPGVDNQTRRNALLIRGNAHFATRELAEALSDFRQAQAIADGIDVAYALGSTYVNSGRPNDAIIEYSKVVDAGAATAIVFNARGGAYQNANQLEASIEDFNKALFLNPSMLVAINNRAAAYAKMKNFPAALKDIETILDKEPNMPLALLNKCSIIARTTGIDAAQPWCNRANTAGAEDFFIQQGLGGAYHEAGRHREAAQHFERSIYLLPNNAYALYGRGLAREKLGMKAESQADIAEAQKMQPNIADTWQRLK